MANNQPTSIQYQFMPMDRLTVLALLYLSLPIFIYLIGWFEPAISIPAAFLVAYGGYLATNKITIFPFCREKICDGYSTVILLVALAWSLFGGAGHFFFANFDWVTRDAVLRDLTVSTWPVSYGQAEGFATILRAPIAYFLPAAVAGKVFGLAHADFLLWLWTFVGIWMFLKLLPRSESNRKNIFCLMVVVLFSGMDILGWLKNQPIPLTPGLHLEWWAQLFQYSSNSTQLFWVPNHALPAWLVVALFARHRGNLEFARVFPLLCALLPLWSPLVAVGFTPFVLLYLADKQRAKAFLTPANLWSPAVVLVLTCPYLLLDMQTVPLGSNTDGANTPIQFFVHYGFFLILEFAILALLIYEKTDKRLLMTCVMTLSALPFLRLGPGNDIVMRGGIPALMLLCVLIIRYIQQTEKINSRVFLVFLVLLAGAVTPLQEFYRAATTARWSSNLSANLIQASDGQPAHYVARLNNTLLIKAMKTPQQVP